MMMIMKKAQDLTKKRFFFRIHEKKKNIKSNNHNENTTKIRVHTDPTNLT